MTDTTVPPIGSILGLRHVKIPVTDLVRSRAWYEQVFDLVPLREFRDDHDGVVRGVSYRSLGDLALALREQPDVARGLAGFDCFATMLLGREAASPASGMTRRSASERAINRPDSFDVFLE